MKIKIESNIIENALIEMLNIVCLTTIILYFISQNYAITDAVQKIASEYKCKPIEGMLSHQLKQGKIDGEKTIIQNPNEAQRKEHEKCEFALHEVYAIDVLISSGEGVGREKDTKVSIFKKTDENYQLKLKASRALITEVSVFPYIFCFFFLSFSKTLLQCNKLGYFHSGTEQTRKHAI